MDNYEWHKHSLYKKIKNKVSRGINIGPGSVEMAAKLEMRVLTNLISGVKVKTKQKYTVAARPACEYTA